MKRSGAPLRWLAAALACAGILAVSSAAAHDAKLHTGAKSSRPVATAPAAPPAALPLNVGGPFALVDQTGKSVTDRDFLGRPLLVFFGYANCPGICPTALRAMVDAVDLLGAAGERVVPILITVDPEHDRPETLAAVVAEIHPRLIGLTGSAEELAAAAHAYGVTAKPAGRSWNGIDMIDHGSLVYLMGPDGKLLTIFPPIMDGAAMAAAMRGYLH